ncbi:MAG: cell division protein CrgA, partial [Ilumatobacteraceae bacterium]
VDSRAVAPPKRKTGGRTTPAGTRPTDSKRAGTATVGEHGDTATHHYQSGRYTAPIPHSQKESPPWVPALMLGLLVVGALLIMLRYLVWDDTNLPMVLGMACLLGGLYTGTKWR